MDMSNEPNSRRMLRSYIERVSRLGEEIANLKRDIADILAEAKSNGFSAAAIKRAVKIAAETPEQRAKREEVESLTDLYLANLGMLGGMPLGEAARARLNRQPQTQRPSEPDDDPDLISPAPDATEHHEPGSEETIGAEQIAAARERGRADARAGRKILENPYVAGDPRRAAWDEGHCEETGSDGMDLPEAWRPKAKKKPGNDKPDGGEGGEG